MKFEIPYYLRNNGDGSASLVVCDTYDEAKLEDESQSEGWGESSADMLDMTVTGNILTIGGYHKKRFTKEQ